MFDPGNHAFNRNGFQVIVEEHSKQPFQTTGNVNGTTKTLKMHPLGKREPKILCPVSQLESKVLQCHLALPRCLEDLTTKAGEDFKAHCMAKQSKEIKVVQDRARTM